MHTITFMKAFSAIALSVSFIFAAVPDSSQGGPGSDSARTLDKIVVTASRTQRLLSETPAGVSVITKNAISGSAANSI
jgi:outer membrane cobalamin receptor